MTYRYLTFCLTALLLFCAYLIPPERQYEDLINEGDKLLNNKKYQSAFRTFERALQMDKNRVDAWYGLGVSLNMWCNKKGDSCEAALDYLNKAASINPDYRYLHYNRALCREKMNDPLGALADYNEAIRRYPTDVDAVFGRGHLYLVMLKDSTSACRDISKAISLGGGKDIQAWADKACRQ